ncbi:hypothetical protein TWF696_004144 [Orbilia brochopaga]|uniref:Uncharacterized protein n=1 Tax=Orbilia brochopaga TaxID=3140254 RepID=A0AAV9V8F0_9PEZI
MPSTTLLFLSFLHFSLSYSLPTPTTGSTATTTATSTATSTASTNRFSLSAGVSIICGVVAICLIAVGALFYGYRKYNQRKLRRRTQIRMDQMQSSLAARLQQAQVKEEGAAKVYEGDNRRGVHMHVTEITAGSPVEQPVVGEKNPFKSAIVRDRPAR